MFLACSQVGANRGVPDLVGDPSVFLGAWLGRSTSRRERERSRSASGTYRSGTYKSLGPTMGGGSKKGCGGRAYGMTRRPRTIEYWTGRLPHWEVEGGRYFITLHLAGAIPAEGRKRLRAMAKEFREISEHDSPDWLRSQRAIFAEMERWLDRVGPNAFLGQSDIAEMVLESIEHRCERGDWEMLEYVVMPTHLHLFCEIGSQGLKATMEDFKRWTGHRAAQLLSVDGDRFWQREWFDHWSLSDDEDERIVRYARNNPVTAQLVDRYCAWPFGSWSRSPLPDGNSGAR